MLVEARAQFDGLVADGTRVVYRTAERVNVDDHAWIRGSGEVNLTGSGRRRSPAWSPDGERIAFAAGGEMRFVMAPDGSGVRRVTEIWGEYPAWFRTAAIVFASYVGGPTGDPDYDLYVIDATGAAAPPDRRPGQ